MKISNVKSRLPRSRIFQAGLMAGYGVAAVMLVGLSRSASATLIDVQFYGVHGGTNAAQSGAAVTGAPGDQWNALSSTGTSPAVSGNAVALFDSGGGSTGATLTWNARDAYTATSGFFGFFGTSNANLMSDILAGDGAHHIDVFVRGLLANTSYNIWLYTQGDNNSSGRAVTFDINGVTGTTVQSGNLNHFVSGNNYISVAATTNALGALNIHQTGFTAEADLNGFQLSGVVNASEPGSLASLATGLLVAGHLAFRRSRRQAGAKTDGSRSMCLSPKSSAATEVLSVRTGTCNVC